MALGREVEIIDLTSESIQPNNSRVKPPDVCPFHTPVPLPENVRDYIPGIAAQTLNVRALSLNGSGDDGKKVEHRVNPQSTLVASTTPSPPPPASSVERVVEKVNDEGALQESRENLQQWTTGMTNMGESNGIHQDNMSQEELLMEHDNKPQTVLQVEEAAAMTPILANEPPVLSKKRLADGTIKTPEAYPLPAGIAIGLRQGLKARGEAMRPFKLNIAVNTPETSRGTSPATPASRYSFRPSPSVKKMNTPPVQTTQTRHSELTGIFKDMENGRRNPQTGLPLITKTKFEKFTEEEDRLIIYLKEDLQLSWKEIGSHFIGCQWNSLQARYSKKLSNRNSPLPTKRKETPITKSVPSNGFNSPIYISSDSIEPEPQKTSVMNEINPAPKRRGRPPKASRVLESPDDSEPEDESFFADELGIRRAIEQINSTTDCLKTSIMSLTSGPHIRVPRQKKLPYLNWKERYSLHKGFDKGKWNFQNFAEWMGALVHVDIQDAELESIAESVLRIIRPSYPLYRDSLQPQLSRLLRGMPENKILEISWDVKTKVGLHTRTVESLRSFLEDCAAGKVSSNRSFQRLGAPVAFQPALAPPSPSPPHSRRSVAALLRQRELGNYDTPGRYNPSRSVAQRWKTHFYDSLGPSMYYTGTSGDVTTVAWCPDGHQFAAGSACLVDDDSMQYNRPYNLLFGSVETRTLLELPDHYIKRRQPGSGVNSSHSMHVTQDPRLFMTISMIDFSPEGDIMYTAGYDQCVRAWDLSYFSNNINSCQYTLKHKARVDLLSVSRTGLLATGCRRPSKNSIKIVQRNDEGYQVSYSFSSQKALDRPDSDTTPSSLRFEPNQGRYLLGGFTSNAKNNDDDNIRSTYGEVCLWDVETGSTLLIHGNTRNVFDCSWNPNCRNQPLFAVGCVAAGVDVNRGTRSVVRMYDWRGSKFTKTMELECPAWDMNDVVYCPYDENYTAAGCTDGKVYVWDNRNPSKILHTLQHGEPLAELSPDRPQEQQDTGIRFCSWSCSPSRLYTGSSDGVVKIWDITRSPDDSFVKDVVSLDSGVMCAAFNPDMTSLLVGEVNGSISLLEVGRDDCDKRDVESFKLIKAETGETLSPTTGIPIGEESGVEAAARLVQTQQIELRPLGSFPVLQAVQGIGYNGPYDSALDASIRRIEAQRFQDSLVAEAAAQCTLPLCRDSCVRATAEEASDSGRSFDRIPFTLRSSGPMALAAIVPGMVKCARCPRPARPRLEDVKHENVAAICERCNFSCFRCGKDAIVADDDSTIWCLHCDISWTVDVLGYNETRYYGQKSLPRAPSTEEAKTKKKILKPSKYENDLLWHYHSQWTEHA